MGDQQQPVPYRRIGAILVERGIITDTQLASALEEQRRSGRLLGEILIDGYRVTRVDLADALAEQWAEAQNAAAAAATVGPESPAGRPQHDDDEHELRVLLEEATSARAELARKTDEIGTRLAALEALVVGVRGALSELRASRQGEPAAEPAAAQGDARPPRPRSGRRSSVSR